MLRVADLLPIAPRSLAPLPSKSAEPAAAASWFDDDGAGLAPCIVADVGADARGLSVGEHAARVLAQLCGGDADLSR